MTGSRISVPNQVSISPVTFVSALDIQTTGVTRVEDLLNELPQVFADAGLEHRPTAQTAPRRSTCAAWAPSAPWCWWTVFAWAPAIRARAVRPPTSTDSGRTDRQHRSADRRRLLDVRCGRGRGRGELQAQRSFRGREAGRRRRLYNHTQQQDTEGVRSCRSRPRHFRAGALESITGGAQKSRPSSPVSIPKTARAMPPFTPRTAMCTAVLQSKYSYSACTLARAMSTSNSGKLGGGSADRRSPAASRRSDPASWAPATTPSAPMGR